MARLTLSSALRRLGSTRGSSRALLDALLRPFAQVVFSRDLTVGALVLGAVAAARPGLALAALGAAALAGLAARALGLGGPGVREGAHGCMGALTLIALVAFVPAAACRPALLVCGVLLAVLFSAAAPSLLAPLGLPAYTLPFVLATWATALAGRALPLAGAPSALLAWTPACLRALAARRSWLDVPAQTLFLQGPLAGGGLLLALGVHSRVSLLLALAGGLTADGLRAALGATAGSPLEHLAGMNAALTALALGGIWFVPGPAALALGCAGGAVASLLTRALAPALAALSLPALSLPFVMTTAVFLAAARGRERDRAPRACRVPDERPEQTLARDLLERRRLGGASWLPFRLPFRGEWVVTQATDGVHTHQGPWRHALDFEGQAASGLRFEREGRALGDFVCYGLPVLAAGAGTVVQVIDGIADNPVGELNTRESWGNVVILAHGLGLHTVYAHLQPGSLRVQPGQVVADGAELGRCGNSGRSAVPHLHFQLQRGAALGSETLPADFGDVIERRGGRCRLHTRITLAEGAVVRPVVRDEPLVATLPLVPGSAWVLEEGRRQELCWVEVDPLNRWLLRSERACLRFEPYPGGLLTLELEGAESSLLRPLFLALPRLPFDLEPELAWEGVLPRRALLPSLLRPLADLAPLLWPWAERLDARIQLSWRRREDRVELEGHGPRYRSRCVLATGGGPHRLEVTLGGRTRRIALRRLESPTAITARDPSAELTPLATRDAVEA